MNEEQTSAALRKNFQGECLIHYYSMPNMSTVICVPWNNKQCLIMRIGWVARQHLIWKVSGFHLKIWGLVCQVDAALRQVWAWITKWFFSCSRACCTQWPQWLAFIVSVKMRITHCLSPLETMYTHPDNTCIRTWNSMLRHTYTALHTEDHTAA